MNRILLVVAFIGFSASLFARTTDPMVPQIAADLGVDVHWVTLLGTAFALPWALMQPILGPLGDLMGKGRVITVCLVILVASAIVGAMATTFPVLLASRIIGGAAAGGVNPVAMALIADLVPVNERQVAWGRVLTANIAGVLMGAAIAGVLADFVSWRSVFVVVGACVALAMAASTVALRGLGRSAREVSFAAVLATYRQVLSNPRTKICYGAVFAEGAALFGLFPFIAVFLLAANEPRASIAGLVISGFALGGVIYTLVVRMLVTRFGRGDLMVGGGGMVALGLALQAFLPPWPLQLLAMCVVGFGFYLMHTSIMVEMSELAPEARGTAVAGHACAFYLGQALGPVAFALAIPAIGAASTILAAGIVMLAIGVITARLLNKVSAS
jgi:predicted MFS family arabinose efflux permease